MDRRPWSARRSAAERAVVSRAFCELFIGLWHSHVAKQARTSQSTRPGSTAALAVTDTQLRARKRWYGSYHRCMQSLCRTRSAVDEPELAADCDTHVSEVSDGYCPNGGMGFNRQARNPRA
jgi:hypothetical protein